MKAFLVGLVVIILVSILTLIFMGLGILLSPILVVAGLALRLIVFIAFVIFGIWLLGKLVIMIWNSLRSGKKEEEGEKIK